MGWGWWVGRGYIWRTLCACVRARARVCGGVGVCVWVVFNFFNFFILLGFDIPSANWVSDLDSLM